MHMHHFSTYTTASCNSLHSACFWQEMDAVCVRISPPWATVATSRHRCSAVEQQQPSPPRPPFPAWLLCFAPGLMHEPRSKTTCRHRTRRPKHVRRSRLHNSDERITARWTASADADECRVSCTCMQTHAAQSRASGSWQPAHLSALCYSHHVHRTCSLRSSCRNDTD